MDVCHMQQPVNSLYINSCQVVLQNARPSNAYAVAKNSRIMQSKKENKMNRSFIGNLNEVEIRHAKKGCMCKVCDRELNDDMIVYLRSCRLHGQPYHICIPCWRKINALINEELDKISQSVSAQKFQLEQQNKVNEWQKQQFQKERKIK